MYPRLLVGVVLILLSCVSPVWAAQGQWAGFLYLTPKGSALNAEQKAQVVETLNKAGEGFHNDFQPDAKAMDTIQYIRGTGYDLNGNSVAGSVPTVLVRVESPDAQKVKGFLGSVAQALDGLFQLDFRLAVTDALNYTDAATLARLKKEAPKRGNGNDQPNAVVFPLSKSPEWWKLTPDKRTDLFFAHEDKFGPGHLGHNGIGFLYINKIFRKLYHSRFIDPQQDFMTYFEYSDTDRETFNSLLSGLRDTARNQEWQYVKEEPIFWGKRVEGPQDLL